MYCQCAPVLALLQLALLLWGTSADIHGTALDDTAGAFKSVIGTVSDRENLHMNSAARTEARHAVDISGEDLANVGSQHNATEAVVEFLTQLGQHAIHAGSAAVASLASLTDSLSQRGKKLSSDEDVSLSRAAATKEIRTPEPTSDPSSWGLASGGSPAVRKHGALPANHVAPSVSSQVAPRTRRSLPSRMFQRITHSISEEAKGDGLFPVGVMADTQSYDHRRREDIALSRGAVHWLVGDASAVRAASVVGPHDEWHVHVVIMIIIVSSFTVLTAILAFMYSGPVALRGLLHADDVTEQRRGARAAASAVASEAAATAAAAAASAAVGVSPPSGAPASRSRSPERCAPQEGMSAQSKHRVRFG